MRYDRWYILILCFLLACLLEGCAASEDPEPGAIDALPYVIGSDSNTDYSDSGNNTFDRLNPNVQAQWSIERLQITSDGWGDLDMMLSYPSPLRPNFHFLGGALFLSVEAIYRVEGEYIGAISGKSRHLLFAPIALDSRESGTTTFTYSGPFEIPPSMSGCCFHLVGLVVSFSWVRMYYDRIKGDFFEWASSRDMTVSGMRVGQVYHDIHGEFDVYQPIPANEAGILSIPAELDLDGDGVFAYSYWIPSHLPQDE